jgi:hypothetical protein
MSAHIRIVFAQGPVVAFYIDLDLYFYKGAPIPTIYDAELVKQVVYNIDSWFQAKTALRYSYQGFIDMVEAFRDALRLSYSTKDVIWAVQHSAKQARDYILVHKLGEYLRTFWIEALDPAKLESIYLEALRRDFDKLRRSLGDDRLFNHLCRFYKVAENVDPVAQEILERLIIRLGRTPAVPTYPETDLLDQELMRTVLKRLPAMPTYRGVPALIQQKVEMLVDDGTYSNEATV